VLEGEALAGVDDKARERLIAMDKVKARKVKGAGKGEEGCGGLHY
jgi:hypothetical protein